MWYLDWENPAQGEHMVTSRATDKTGQIQPAMDDPWIAKKKTLVYLYFFRRKKEEMFLFNAYIRCACFRVCYHEKQIYTDLKSNPTREKKFIYFPPPFLFCY